MGYRTLAAGPDRTAEIEVKRSRFLAVLRRVESEEAARALTAELRRTHHGARHHCSAFVIGSRQELQRSNDDGEPAGTAGMPMLQVLLGAGISDVAAVVVRWFGGTLLGAGGLVRAYGDAVTAAVADAPLVRRERRVLADLQLPHVDAGRVESELRTAGATVLGTDYAAAATLHLATADLDSLRSLVAAATAGAGRVAEVGSSWIDLAE